MEGIESEARDVVFRGRYPAKRVDLTCPHGSSTVAVLLGTDHAANAAAMRLVAVRHAVKHGCDCASASQSAEVV